MRIAVVILAVALTLLNLFMLEQWVNREPEVITEYVQVPPVIIKVPYEVVKEVIVEKVIIEEVETTIEIPMVLKEFESLEALDEFLSTAPRWVLIITLYPDKKPNYGNCEDIAERLADNAHKAGFEMSTEHLTPKEYFRWYGKSISANERHAICKTCIGNDWYYIEPTSFRYWLAVYND